MKDLTFLPAVQGIRAIAVIAVVLYHFHPKSLPFGYLGVDIFFVISGFIVSYIYSGKIFSLKSIFKFYSKRILRIYPSLILVLLIVTYSSIFLDRTEELKKTSQESIMAIFSVINFYFSTFNSEYFSIDIINNPFLHLWSISTEMQFYLLFPFIFFLFQKLNKKLLYIITSLVIIFSLIFYLDLIKFNNFSNYYLLHSRFWQFILGILIFKIYTFGHKIKSLNFQKINLFVLNITFILILVFMYFRMPFNLNGISITLLTGVLILSSSMITNSHNILTNTFFQFLGKLSFSIYIWHWIILYFIKKFFNFNLFNSLLGLIIIIIISYITYNYWEIKFRVSLLNKRYLQKFIFLFSVLFITNLISTTPISQLRFEGLKQKLSNYELRKGFTELEKNCILDYGEDFSKWGEMCLKNSASEKIVFWGDSHAVALAEAFQAYNINDSLEVSLLSTSSCPPILLLDSRISPNNLCKINNDFVYNSIVQSKPDKVVLVARWYVYANQEWYKSGLKSLQQTIFELKKLGISDIYLIASSPEWGEPLPNSLWKEAISNSSFSQFLPNSRVSSLRDINFNLNEMAADAKIFYLDPLSTWCNRESCKTYNFPNFYLYQIDADHLSIGSAREVLQLLKLI